MENKLEQLMAERHFLTEEEYKELDELMTYIIESFVDKEYAKLAREGIIAYTELWHGMQNGKVLEKIEKIEKAIK